MNAAAASRGELPGKVPQRRRASASVATLDDSVESRAMVALGFPLPPLALLALLDRKQSRYLKRQTYQALAFNAGMFAFGMVLWAMLSVPFLMVSAGILMALLVPVYMVMSIVYGIKAYNGDDVNIPIISDWIDERLPAQ